MEDAPRKWQRVTLTKAASATALGKELIKLLGGFLKDGALQTTDVEALRTWLAQAREETNNLPSIAALRDIVECALADGQITNEERCEIVSLMLRILPAKERADVQPQVHAVNEAEIEAAREDLAKAREEAEKARLAEEIARRKLRAEAARQREEQKKNMPPRWHFDEATDAQIRYLKALGADFDESTLTKGQASDLIQHLLDSPAGVSNRHMMLLRFWDKVAVADQGKEFVNQWLDGWHSEDPDRIAAWESWKESHGDWGCKETDPNIVTLGCGTRWLEIVKRRRKSL